MPSWTDFIILLSRHARGEAVEPGSLLFGEGLALSSINFLDFILDLEESYSLDIDVESLDASVRTAGQLYDRIFAGGA